MIDLFSGSLDFSLGLALYLCGFSGMLTLWFGFWLGILFPGLLCGLGYLFSGLCALTVCTVLIVNSGKLVV